MTTLKVLTTKLILCLSFMVSVAIAEQRQNINLQQALVLALGHDAQIAGLMEQKTSWHELSEAVQAWEDPSLRFGALSVPIDSFDLEQEPMTQLVMGYQQKIPRGDSLQNKSSVMQANAGVTSSQIDLRKRQVIREVKKAWYEVMYREKEIKIINDNRKLFEEMLDINQAFYASGRVDQQSVVQAELDISLIDDRLQRMQSDLLVAKVSLEKWLGQDLKLIDENKHKQHIHTVENLRELQPLVNAHPNIKKSLAKLEKRQGELALEKDKYKSQWGIDVSYGYRQGENIDGSDRADFITAMVSVELPLFAESKQDRQVAARRSDVQSARYEIIDTQREMLKQLKQIHAKMEKLKQRLNLYLDKIRPQAKQNAEVAMRSYQSGVVDFITLSKAQVTEFNARVGQLKLQHQFDNTKADLEFLTGVGQ